MMREAGPSEINIGWLVNLYNYTGDYDITSAGEPVTFPLDPSRRTIPVSLPAYSGVPST